jgi:hypothetical protein
MPRRSARGPVRYRAVRRTGMHRLSRPAPFRAAYVHSPAARARELALEGRHAEAECNDCHVDPVADQRGSSTERAPSARAATPTRTTHSSIRTRPSSQRRSTARAPPVTGVRPSPRRPRASITGAGRAFEVRGAHAQEECESCHAPAEHPDSSGRSFGRVSDVFAPYQGCVTCHETRTRDASTSPRWSARSRVARVARAVTRRARSASSARTSITSSGRVMPSTALTHRSTALRVTRRCGRPTGTAAPGPRPRGRNARIATMTCTRVSSCRKVATTAHAATRARRTSMSSCFDHEHDSRFPLGLAHEMLACSACHKPSSESVGLIRYRPIPRECADCHGRQDDPLRRPKGRRG